MHTGQEIKISQQANRRYRVCFAHLGVYHSTKIFGSAAQRDGTLHPLPKHWVIQFQPPTIITVLHNCMPHTDRFNPRSWQHHVWTCLGLMHYLIQPLIWLAGVWGHATPRRRGRRTTMVSRTAGSRRMPKARAIQPPRTRRIRPQITTSKRWINSVGRYQTRHHNTRTGLSTYSFRVRDLTK